MLLHQSKEVTGNYDKTMFSSVDKSATTDLFANTWFGYVQHNVWAS